MLLRFDPSLVLLSLQLEDFAPRVARDFPSLSPDEIEAERERIQAVRTRDPEVFIALGYALMAPNGCKNGELRIEEAPVSIRYNAAS
jgi:hypothetical protein